MELKGWRASEKNWKEMTQCREQVVTLYFLDL